VVEEKVGSKGIRSTETYVFFVGVECALKIKGERLRKMEIRRDVWMYLCLRDSPRRGRLVINL
jgi:hypothetical protein